MVTKKIESELAEIVRYTLQNNRYLSIAEYERFDKFFAKAIPIIINSDKQFASNVKLKIDFLKNS